ncbi:MAG: hypothetical protein ACI857_001405, partial [Arenicella sp.]
NLDSNVESVNITADSGTSINYIGCPGVIGLEDLSGTENVTFTAGNSYTMFVQFGTCGGNWAGAGEVYIDFNLDEIFDFSEIVGSWSGTPPTAISTFNFTVPAGSMDGIGRIRVIQDESSSNPVNPCASFTWGSVVDFGMTITGGVDCGAYVGNSMDDPRPVSALPYQENHNSSFCYSNEDPVYSSPDVYYQLVLSDFNLDYINVSLCGSSFDTYLSIQDLDTNVLFVNDDDGICSPQSALTFPTIGLDTVLVLVQGWGNESGDYEINIEEDISASIQNLDSKRLEIFPNPARNSITIKNLNSQVEYVIFNELGAEVQKGTTSNLEQIDITGLKAGIYPVQIIANDKHEFFKLIIH